MDFNSLGRIVSLALTAAEEGVVALALVRRLWRRLPWFTAYLVILGTIDLARWAVLYFAGYASRAYAWTFWLSQALLVLARGTSIADICRAALGYYRGVWQLARSLLAATAVVLLSTAALRTAGSSGVASYIIFVERELEFAVVVILLLLLAVMRYYGVRVEPPLGGIIFGLVFYSLVVIFSTSVLTGPLALSWPVLNTVRTSGFDAALVCWAYALRRPLADPVRPALTRETEFVEASGLVDQRMRDLNARLLQLMKR